MNMTEKNIKNHQKSKRLTTVVKTKKTKQKRNNFKL